MFLSKIKSKESGVLLYGITPPKSQTEPEKIQEIADRTLSRLQTLDIDALVVYDVQDESARTSVERPFPFLSALDPFDFARAYLHSLAIPKIIYRPAGKFTKNELKTWVGEVVTHDFSMVFVGVPAPDFQPITSLTEAYQIWSEYNEKSVIGAIMIPERHAVLNDEDQRIIDKMESGVSYFISQCVFNVDYAKRVVEDLSNACTIKHQPLPTLIFTLTACGSQKTLTFMEWLGIDVPLSVKEELMAADDILAKSVELCLYIAKELIEYCSAKGIPFGFNIESVAIRKTEIEASIALVNTIGQMLKDKGLR
jgi:Methylenetetrahydrofolate reductase